MNRLVSFLVKIYVTIAIIYAIYGTYFGKYEYRGFGYNLGRAIIWPATMFPEVGKFLGGLIVLMVIVWIAIGRR